MVLATEQKYSDGLLKLHRVCMSGCAGLLVARQKAGTSQSLVDQRARRPPVRRTALRAPRWTTIDQTNPHFTFQSSTWHPSKFSTNLVNKSRDLKMALQLTSHDFPSLFIRSDWHILSRNSSFNVFLHKYASPI